MGRLVSVSKSGIQGVQLANQHPYNVGDYVVLSNDEFAVTNPASYGADAILTDQGSFPFVNQNVTGPGSNTSYPVSYDTYGSDTVQLGNAAASARTNFGRYEPLNDKAAALVTAQVTFVPVFLHDGDVITNILVKVGATAAGTPTHGFLALYSPTGALLHQTADFTTTARAANATIDAALTATYTVAAGSGGVYFVGVGFTATTVPSLLSRVVPNPSNQNVKPELGLAPLAQKTVGGSYGASAPATISGATGITESTIAPLVILH